MEFLLQLIAEMIKNNENEANITVNEEAELVHTEEDSLENIFGMMHFH